MRRIALACGVGSITFLVGTFAYLLWLGRRLPEARRPAQKPFEAVLPARPAEVPEYLKKGHLTEPNLFERGHREALTAVTEEVARDGGVAAKYYAQVELPDEHVMSPCRLRDRKSYLVFHLWHVSAFRPENLNVLGNPGGKCMSMLYDERQKKIVKKWGWR
jgi:hypothetical protein